VAIECCGAREQQETWRRDRVREQHKNGNVGKLYYIVGGSEKEERGGGKVNQINGQHTDKHRTWLCLRRKERGEIDEAKAVPSIHAKNISFLTKSIKPHTHKALLLYQPPQPSPPPLLTRITRYSAAAARPSPAARSPGPSPCAGSRRRRSNTAPWRHPALPASAHWPRRVACSTRGRG
jgi:hypothetical protein